MSLTNTALGRRPRRGPGGPPPPWRSPRAYDFAAAGAATLDRVVGVGRLMACLESNRRGGGQAPGPDGFRYRDFGRQESARALQRLRESVLAGTYRTPPPRLVKVPKATPGDYRTLALDDLTHRALTASVLRAVAPLYAPRLSQTTYSAGTPARGVSGLLADLAAAWEFGDHTAMLNLDIKTAFPSVPVGPLMAVVRGCVPDGPLAGLVERLVRGADTGNNTLGIPQGSALSPAHLDLYLYLSVGLDAPWSSPPESPPLYRYVDNLACLASSVSEGRRKVARCRDLLSALGLHLRDQPEAKYLIDLKEGQATDLLGFSVSLSGGLMRYGTTDAALELIRGRLEEAHESNNPPGTAQSVLTGWFNSVGPSFESSRSVETVRAVLSCARKLGFKEFSLAQSLEAWSSSYGRWNVRFLQPARARARASRGTP